MHVPITPLEFRRRAERLFGGKVGVIDGENRFTYAEFGNRSRRLGAALQTLGADAGQVVSFLTYNTHHLLEAYYGCLQAGAVLNPVNIRLRPQQIASILNHAECHALFFHADFTPLVEAMRGELRTVTSYVVLEGGGRPALPFHDYEALLNEATPIWVDPVVNEDSVAELFYTSGTTGSPRGVMLTHRTLYLHALYSMISARTTDATVYLHVVPMFHVNGWGAPHTVTAAGGVHVLLRRIDPPEILRLIQKERVTDLRAVPAIFNALINHPDIGRYDLSSLREAVVGGSPVSVALISTMREKLGCEVFAGYGLTETCPVLTSARPRAHLRHEPPARQLERRSYAGYAIPGVELRVVDEHGHDISADGKAVGEIVARSNVVMKGYLKDPEGTADAVRDGWFYTGDLATIDTQGEVNIVDRRKDVIISGGENISSVQVEDTLQGHPAVYECAVIAVPDDRWGEVPKALVVLKPGCTATERGLLEFCRERLAHFQAPKSVEFMDALPKGGTGKILKAELREKYWSGEGRRVR
jgi:fatty-acyl-CoA synthase